MRNLAPIWWNEQPPGVGGFDDGGFWVVTKHTDVMWASVVPVRASASLARPGGPGRP